MLKTGPVILTSWPSSKPKSSLPTIELGEWTFDSKLRLLKHIKPQLSLAALKFLLQESIYVPTALEASCVWGNTFLAREDIEEDFEAPSVNLRRLVEESFTCRWNDRRTAALDSCDMELSLGLVQEMTVSAAFQGQCSIHHVAAHLDSLSFMDVSSRCTREICSEILSSRLIQRKILGQSQGSLAKFSSGSLIPLPESLIKISKARTRAVGMHDSVKKSRNDDEDTRKFSEETQLFIEASGGKYVTPYPKQK
jgi:hypothetical protein